MNFSLRVPAKIILFGEHAAVYGEKVLASAINLYTTVEVNSIEETTEKKFVVSFPNTTETFDLTDILELKKTFPFDVQSPKRFETDLINHFRTQNLNPSFGSLLVALCPSNLTSLNLISSHISITNHCPIGAGLGSSASFAVASVATLCTLFHIRSTLCCGDCMTKANPTFCKAQKSFINKWAYSVECHFHGTPSGVDNAITTFGGFLCYQKETLMCPFSCRCDLTFAIVSTSVERSTEVLVKSVREKKENVYTKERIEKTIREIGNLSETGFQLFSTFPSNGSYDELCERANEIITHNQECLRALDVSIEANEVAIAALESCLHGCRAKLTGAGGGGCVFALISPKTEQEIAKLQEVLASNPKSKDFRVYKASLDHDGLKFVFFNR